jgi:molybdenum cofactor biosynthesis enzyme MoaA
MPKTKNQSINELLSQYDIIGTQDLAVTSNDSHEVYKFLAQLSKSFYEPNQRIVFYGSTPDLSLIVHIQKAAKLFDITKCFIIIACDTDITEILNEANQSLDDYDDTVMQWVQYDYNGDQLRSNYKISSTICAHPWTSIEIETDGSFRPCCVYAGKIYDEKGQAININTHTIADYYHSDHMKSLRTNLRNGQKPQGCKDCWQRENSGQSSVRTWNLDLHVKKFLTQSLSHESLDRVRSLDMDLGNLCNLRCGICSWKRSSQIAKDLLNDPTIDSKKDLKIKIKQYNQSAQWHEKDFIWNKFQSILPSLEYIEMEGGEPFFHDYHVNIIDRIVSLHTEQNVRLRYNSNATIFPEKYIDRWTRFKQVAINLSIDDLDQRFEYQRTDSDWKQVTDNLKRYSEITYDNIEVSIFVTVNMQNIFYIPELLDFLHPFGWTIHFNLLFTPKPVSIENITAESQQAILDKFSKNKHLSHYLEPLILGVKNIKPCDGSAFRSWIAEKDRTRTPKYAEVHPEMAKLMHMA